MDFKAVEFVEDKAILKKCSSFDIKQTFECGQCFRWERTEKGTYIGVVQGRVIELEQIGEDITIHNTNKDDFENLWIDYFDLERNYSEIKKILSKDELLNKAVEYGHGIRLLNQDPFELVVSFIISARNSIPVIMKTIKKISEKFGNPIEYKGKIYYTFPTPKELNKATLEEVVETGASFRGKYIVDTVDKVNAAVESGIYNDEFNLDRIKNLDDNECHIELQKFKGIGAKVADCIMLFSMRKYSAFPVDVWVKRAMQHFYLAPDVSLPKIRIFGRDKFKELSGFAQQYLFYYARENNIKL